MAFYPVHLKVLAGSEMSPWQVDYPTWFFVLGHLSVALSPGKQAVLVPVDAGLWDNWTVFGCTPQHLFILQVCPQKEAVVKEWHRVGTSKLLASLLTLSYE